MLKSSFGPIVEGHLNTLLPPHAVQGGKATQTYSFWGLGLNSDDSPLFKTLMLVESESQGCQQGLEGKIEAPKPGQGARGAGRTTNREPDKQGGEKGPEICGARGEGGPGGPRGARGAQGGQGGQGGRGARPQVPQKNRTRPAWVGLRPPGP